MHAQKMLVLFVQTTRAPRIQKKNHLNFKNRLIFLCSFRHERESGNGQRAEQWMNRSPKPSMNTLPLFLALMLAACKSVRCLLSTAGHGSSNRKSAQWRLFSEGSDLDDLMDMVLTDPDLFKRQRYSSNRTTIDDQSSLWKSFDWESIPVQELRPSPVETMLVMLC